MMFLSGVSNLTAFDVAYMHNQLGRDKSQYIQKEIVRATAGNPETGEGAVTLHRDSRWVTGKSAAEAEMAARIAAEMAERKAAAAASKKTMLLAGGAVAAILAFVALKG